LDVRVSVRLVHTHLPIYIRNLWKCMYVLYRDTNLAIIIGRYTYILYYIRYFPACYKTNDALILGLGAYNFLFQKLPFYTYTVISTRHSPYYNFYMYNIVYNKYHIYIYIGYTVGITHT